MWDSLDRMSDIERQGTEGLYARTGDFRSEIYLYVYLFSLF